MSFIYQHKFHSVLVSLLSFSLSSSIWALSTWQGPYAGAFLGSGLGDNHVSTNSGNVTDTSYFSTQADINAVNNAGTWTANPNAVIAGIQAGHNWEWKHIVYGITLDYSPASLSSSKTITNTYPDSSNQYSIYTSMRTNWLFTLRGRLGYPTTLYFPSLFYVTGGMAMTQLKISNNFTDNSVFAGTANNNTSQDKIGWASGAGIEVAAFNHLSVNFEYLYITVPSIKTTSTISNTAGGFGIPVQSMNSFLSSTANFHANLFTLGLNYRFDE